MFTLFVDKSVISFSHANTFFAVLDNYKTQNSLVETMIPKPIP